MKPIEKVTNVKRLAIFAFGLGLAGCVESSIPVVSDYNGASVKIQEPGLFTSTPPSAAAIAEAGKICKTAGKRANFASSSMVSEYRVDHLFLCL